MMLRISVIIAALVAAPQALTAEDLVVPTGPVLLTVSGADLPAYADEPVQFDLEMLRALDASVIETTTIWTDGTQTFVGVSLAVLLETMGVEVGTLLATAINDYTVEIPVSDAVEDGPVIVYELNGELMSVRDKGPLWIVYPYDTSSDYQTEVIYSRSIWQLDRLEVVD